MTEYESSRYGYVPHSDQTKAVCPKCGNGLFEVYPQTIVADAKIWCYEHVCTKCRHGYVIEVVRNV